ncbi:MAG TPA: hypothetical protein VGL40_08290 [Bacillota bacterium]|jgi:hypothetical protein
MPWPCRLVDGEKVRSGEYRPQVGDMWYMPWLLEDKQMLDFYCSKEYHRDWLGKRPPLMVVLPNGCKWIIDSPWRGDPGSSGWTVTGEAPNITVMPSINFVGSYHGWLQNGVFSNDVEGRQIPPVREAS